MREVVLAKLKRFIGISKCKLALVTRHIRNHWPTISCLTGLSATCLVIGLRVSGRTADFLLNLAAGIACTLATILIIDFFLQRRETLRLLPQRQVAYGAVRSYAMSIVDLWHELAGLTFRGEGYSTAAELFSRPVLERLEKELWLDGKVQTTPQLTVEQYLEYCYKKSHGTATSILDRHHMILDPVAYALVAKVQAYYFKPGDLFAIKASDRESGIPRPRILATGALAARETAFQSVLELLAWCNKECILLQSLGAKVSPPPATGLSSAFWKTTQCRIPPELLREQGRRLAEWRSRRNRGH